MATIDITTCVANGAVTYADRDEPSGQIQWNEHPKFKGVYLKHLVRGEDTGGMLSCHLVRIDSNGVLDEHMHENQWELHEIIEGDGILIFGGRHTPYSPGGMGVMPKGVKHKIIAGQNGLVLLAKFFPALL